MSTYLLFTSKLSVFIIDKTIFVKRNVSLSLKLFSSDCLFIIK